MIRTKLGLTALAVNTLGRYASAILQANLSPPPQPASAEVQNPVGSPGIGGTVMPFGYYVFSEPLEFAGELELDVLKLVVDVAYVRHDLGSGERRMTFWLSPTSGLLSVMVDGVIYDRIP